MVQEFEFWAFLLSPCDTPNVIGKVDSYCFISFNQSRDCRECCSLDEKDPSPYCCFRTFPSEKLFRSDCSQKPQNLVDFVAEH